MRGGNPAELENAVKQICFFLPAIRLLTLHELTG